MAEKQAIRVGGAAGFWGDADHATAQLLESGPLDFLVYDYLAEITLSIMARARAKDPSQGYARDFPKTLALHRRNLNARGLRVIANAGGVTPSACAAALREEAQAQGVDL
ncbi:MAG: acyclic terpene utilization AtuA family protein, partial [Pseudomonadota bacterium]